MKPNRSGKLDIHLLAGPESRTRRNGIRLLGVWQMTSPDSRFSGYSGLVAFAGGRLRAYSDRGKWLDFHAPGSGPGNGQAGSAHAFGKALAEKNKFYSDIEAATYDPVSGNTWLSLEFVNAIFRISADRKKLAEATPPAMATFSANGGAEAMTRLSDGRFIVLRETGDPLRPLHRTGLLFAGDPIVNDSAAEFSFRPPAGYDPTDAAQLPDGRVLILLRGLTLAGFPPFASRLVVADPAEIRAGKVWHWQPVADISDIAPRENYEGLAVVPAGRGVKLWLISDSNDSVLMQRTLLVELDWDPSTPARP